MQDRRPEPAEILAVARALHESLESEPEPDFLDARASAYAVADRLAWREQMWSPRGHRLDDVVEGLFALCSDLDVREQLVHYDLVNNIAVGRDSRLVILDFSPFWRSPEYAEGIAVVDLYQWRGNDPTILDLVPRQYVVRGALLRALFLTLMKDVGLSRPDVWESTLNCLAG